MGRYMLQAFSVVSFVLVFSLASPLTMASAGWIRTYQGVDMDLLTPRSVIQTSDGRYALVGSASLFRASTSSVVYSSWVVKTDAQGKQLWKKGYDLLNSQGHDYLIIQTSDSGHAVVGANPS